MNERRIISFLPAATEMAFVLGLGDEVTGVSHECDFPAGATKKPVVVKPALPMERMSLREIDVAVAERIRSGQNLYEVDERLLAGLSPTHILTQDLCHVCAPSGNEITRALAALPVKPEILWFTPHTIEDIFGNLRDLGAATGTLAKAEEFIAKARTRLWVVAERAARIPYHPRVFVLEWIDPYYCCGHWVPEMIELAGGEDALGRKGQDSVRIAWKDIARWSPEVLIVSPCGFGTEKAVEQAKQLLRQPGWSDLPAARDGRVYAVDANAYFSRPGPRVVDGVELLAHLIHPDIFEWNGPRDAYQKITVSKEARQVPKYSRVRAFTLIELLIVIAIIAILSAILLPVLSRGKLSAQCGVCQSNQRELGLAAQMYWNDNAGNSFAYQTGPTNSGVLYWFGWIANGTEGHRAFDLSMGALFPYYYGRDVRLCPSPVWNLPPFQLKGTNVIFSYGCNLFLCSTNGRPAMNVNRMTRFSDVALFADTAQVVPPFEDTTPGVPRFQEFYYVDLETNYGNANNYPNTHFRHGQKANVTFADGHVAMEGYVPGSIDPRMPRLLFGQLPPQMLVP